MFELTINEKVYQFNFGMGFLKEINKLVRIDVEGLKDVRKNIGLRYKLSQLRECDTEALVEILVAANIGFTPRVTAKEIETYIDDETTNIDSLYEDVWGFLKRANALKKMIAAWEEDLAKEEAQRATNNQN